MPFKRLKGATGNLADAAVQQNDTPTSITRDAILVHSGPNGTPIVFESSDGDIKFDGARIKNIVKNQNAMIDKMVAEYGGAEKTPLGAFPPVLDQHSDDSNDRIRGRLNHSLRFEIRDVPKVGKNVHCAVTSINFIGHHAVEQVLDGRIYHLSVGINEETDTLGETSTVIDPAAPGAMLLKKGKTMAKKTLKKAQSASKNKNLAAGKRSVILKQLSSGMADLAKMVKSTNTNMELAKREGAVSSKLTKLMASKKLTPAEHKKLDIKRLAKLDKDSFDTVMATYEAREDVIMSGQRGSKDSSGIGDMGKALEKRQLTRLQKEIRGDFKRLGKKMKEPEGDDEKDMSFGEDDKDKKEDKKASKKKMAFGEEKEEDEGKDLEKEGDGEDKDLAAEEGTEHDEKSYEKLQSQVDELNTNLARMAGMVGELMKCEKEEGEEDELSEGEDEGDKDLEAEDEETEEDKNKA